MTVREITIIDVEPGRESDFAQAYRDQGRNLVLSTPGGEDPQLFQSQEDPARFVSINMWKSQEAHRKNFRDTERFTPWVACWVQRWPALRM